MSTIEDRFILIPTKKSGNYSIVQKDKKRLQFKLKNAYFPFGKEEYNESVIFNIVVDDSNNYSRNMIVELNKLATSFIDLKNTDKGKIIYDIGNKEFFQFITEIIKNDTKNDTNNNDTTKRYQLRTYLKYGAPMMHSKLVGYLPLDFDFRGKHGDIDLEVGSMWINESTSQYGINMYITKIVIK